MTSLRNIPSCFQMIDHLFLIGFDIKFQDTVTAANEYLQKCYINSRYPPTVDEWPPYQPRHYTTLALIHNKDKCTDATVISVAQKLAVAGKFQPKLEDLSSSSGSISLLSNMYSNTTKNISDIFISVTASDGVTINSCTVLIEGAPGIGKTVLAKEIAFQWAYDKLLSNRKILFLLFLRQCNFKSMASFESFVQCVVKSSEMATSLANYLLLTEGSSLTIVFDGYDEISDEDRKTSIVADIINRKILAKCCLVITSRPTASSNLHSIVDCRIEIVGFTEEDRLDYIQTALRGKDDKVEGLTLYLQSNPTINALCYIPLNMTILLCLVENGIDSLPKTQTDMYKRFIEMTIVRFIQKLNMQVSKIITSIAELPHPYDKVFEELTRLAYKALKIDKIVFKLHQIKEICPNLALSSSNWDGLGLLKAVQGSSAEIGNVTFHFLHFSIQEYMAAWYISSLLHRKQIKLLNKTFWEHRYYNAWIMYVGITQGNSFPLKHFLSGNWFQLSTKLFKSSSISKKILRNKIKCLHLFQCLVESNNDDMIASVSKFFQDDQIDLSNQTLLPTDVNTLGFFLIRSFNKQWRMLNLSGCNIGSTGINILCDRFLSKENREIVVIKKVDFSRNQFNFSVLMQLFDLFKSWHASQLIVKDSKFLQNCAISDVYKSIEDAFFSSICLNEFCLELGSFLFGYELRMLENTMSVKNMYLLNCKLSPTISETSIRTLESLVVKNLSEIHLINTSLPTHLFKRWCSNLTSSKANLFFYNPELPDDDADEICSSILFSKITNGLMLIVSNSKIQGIINTSSICKVLTRLEIFNLSVNINRKDSNQMQIYSWKGNLYYDNNSNDSVNDTFVTLLQKVIGNKWSWQLRIILIEQDVLIAHKVNYECISEKIKMPQSLKTIYFSNCSIESKEYQILFKDIKTLTKFCIFNGQIDQDFLEIPLFFCKEIFIHTLCDIRIEKISNFRENCSVTLVTKNKIFACNPNTEQVTLALQLEPSVELLKVLHCENSDCFNQIIMVLATRNTWIKLDFMNCKFREVEFQVLQSYLRVNKKVDATIKVLKVSSEQFSSLLIPTLIEALIICRAQQLIFCKVDYTVYTHFISTLITISEKVCLSVTYNGKVNTFLCNCNWIQITKLLENHSVTTMYIINSCWPENINLTELNHISTLHIINCVLHGNAIIDILETIPKKSWKEIFICNTSNHINDKGVYDFITSKNLLHQGINLVIAMKNFVCGCNTTEDQLSLLQSIDISSLKHDIVTLVNDTKYKQVKDTKQMRENILFIFQNEQLAMHFIKEIYKTDFVTQVFAVIQGTSSLKWFGVNKEFMTYVAAKKIQTILSNTKGLERLYLNTKFQFADLLTIMKTLSKNLDNLKVFEIANNSITDEAADYIANLISCNIQLQEFGVSKNRFQTAGIMIIVKALQNISTLKKLYINDNNILDEAADDIAAVLSCNTELQELDISNNCFRSAGIMMIVKALQNISTLKKLYINDNNILDEAADDIAAVLSCNTELQELDISNNCFRSEGIMTITKPLQNMVALTKLCIGDYNLSDFATDSIAVVVYHNTNLQELDIGLSQFGVICITRALCKNRNLRVLKMKSNGRNIKVALDSIAAAISCNAKLQVLDISGKLDTNILKALQRISSLTKLCITNHHFTDFNDCNTDTTNDLANAISCNTQLQELDISGNYLGTAGAIQLSKALHYIFTLKKLYIDNNNITDMAADDIATALSRNIQLQELSIKKNEFQTKGIITIAKALQNMSTIKKLYISNNNITDEAADGIAAALSCNDKLEVFDISENCFKAPGFTKIAKALQQISTLRQLYINDNNITDEASHDIIAICSHNTFLQALNFNNNAITFGKASELYSHCKKLLNFNANIHYT